MEPTVKFYGSLSGTIGLWLSTTVREHLDTDRVSVSYHPEIGSITIHSHRFLGIEDTNARFKGLKITDNGFISASGFVRKFNLSPQFGFSHRVLTKTPGEIQFIVPERSIQDVQRAAPVPNR